VLHNHRIILPPCLSPSSADFVTEVRAGSIFESKSQVRLQSSPTVELRGLPLKALALLFLLTTPIAFAKDKPVYSYQDGVFQSFRTEQTGNKCSSDADTNGTVNANTDNSGNTNETVHTTTTGSTTCHDTQRTIYTVKVSENTFVLTPAESGNGTAGGYATLGWSRAFAKNNVLAYQLPGAKIQFRSDGKHYSMYSIVGAE
jgi:hypothetical protein